MHSNRNVIHLITPAKSFFNLPMTDHSEFSHFIYRAAVGNGSKWKKKSNFAQQSSLVSLSLRVSDPPLSLFFPEISDTFRLDNYGNDGGGSSYWDSVSD